LFRIKTIKNPVIGFLCSTAMIVGGISASFISMFPTILPSLNGVNPPLTIYNTSTTDYGMSVALVWIVFGLILAMAYFIIQKRILNSKIEELMKNQ
ncbi:MAG: cytochrome d ubiquinol oxidase subunit II, partial [Cruoricaptor ignavus]|nr:cytochrome d ubiquinol oxidase subunit II [Cruoricaptor ignavus]